MLKKELVNEIAKTDRKLATIVFEHKLVTKSKLMTMNKTDLENTFKKLKNKLQKVTNNQLKGSVQQYKLTLPYQYNSLSAKERNSKARELLYFNRYPQKEASIKNGVISFKYGTNPIQTAYEQHKNYLRKTTKQKNPYAKLAIKGKPPAIFMEKI